MSDGQNEPIQFTRGDAERLASVERDVCHVRKVVSRLLNVGYTMAVAVFIVALREVIRYVNGG